MIDNILEFKRNTYARIERTYTNVHMLNRLIAGLAMSENIEECTAAIEQMLDTIGCDDFSLCLVDHWNDTYNTASIEENDDYPPVMTAPFIEVLSRCSQVVSCFLYLLLQVEISVTSFRFISIRECSDIILSKMMIFR